MLNPQHVEAGQATDGFSIGGLNQVALKKNYAPPNAAEAAAIAVYSSKAHDKARQSVKNMAASSSKATLESIYGNRKLKKTDAAAQSFVLNNDMVNIRLAEMILLKEEEKYGVFCRDPEGRFVSALQVRKYPA